MKTIVIIVSPKGDTSVQTKGFAGASCREASKSIEQALGQQTEEHVTSDFHQSEHARQSEHQHQ